MKDRELKHLKQQLQAPTGMQVPGARTILKLLNHIDALSADLAFLKQKDPSCDS